MPVLKSSGSPGFSSVTSVSQAGDVANHGVQSRRAEQESLRTIIANWGPADPDGLERAP
jgi:hypothetical protein